MPRQRIRHSGENYAVPVDFPQRLKRFRMAMKEDRARPCCRHRRALYELAERMDLGHLLTD